MRTTNATSMLVAAAEAAPSATVSLVGPVAAIIIFLILAFVMRKRIGWYTFWIILAALAFAETPLGEAIIRAANTVLRWLGTLFGGASME